MTDIEQKALALVNAVRDDRGYHPLLESFSRKSAETEALCRTIEREAATEARHAPDPLVEAWVEATGNTVGMGPLNEAIAKRGGKIVWEAGE